ncbi:MAG: TIGR00266 family protein [Phycisphaerae bacterium]|nr:TIGR00266 family protein [Phycisphaerae bacterium]
MEITIDGNPDSAEARFSLHTGEMFLAESGAMTRMSPSITIQPRLLGGFLKSLIRKFFGGESLVMGQYTAQQDGDVVVANTTPGSIVHRKLQGEKLVITAGALLACSEGIDIRTRTHGFRQIFSGKGAFVLECSGSGDLVLASFGSIIEKKIDGQLTVDTGHVVAWDPTLDYKIRGMGSIKSTLLSGEGLVMDFTGSGTIWLQTRHLQGFTHWLIPFCRG